MSHPWVTGKTASSELIDEDVFMRLQNFNARRKFRATAYASIVRTKFQLRNKYLKELLGDRVLTAAELEQLRVTFQRMYVVGPHFFEVPFCLFRKLHLYHVLGSQLQEGSELLLYLLTFIWLRGSNAAQIHSYCSPQRGACIGSHMFFGWRLMHHKYSINT